MNQMQILIPPQALDGEMGKKFFFINLFAC